MNVQNCQKTISRDIWINDIMPYFGMQELGRVSTCCRDFYNIIDPKLKALFLRKMGNGSANIHSLIRLNFLGNFPNKKIRTCFGYLMHKFALTDEGLSDLREFLKQEKFVNPLRHAKRISKLRVLCLLIHNKNTTNTLLLNNLTLINKIFKFHKISFTSFELNHFVKIIKEDRRSLLNLISYLKNILIKGRYSVDKHEIDTTIGVIFTYMHQNLPKVIPSFRKALMDLKQIEPNLQIPKGYSSEKAYEV